MKSSRLEEIRRFSQESALCMKCGFCISNCPVYREDLTEASVARGKNALVRGVVSGQLDFTPELEKRLDQCTLCQTCTAGCPAKVNIPSVVVAARADRFRSSGVRFPYNLIYRSILPRRRLFGRTLKSARLMQKLFFPRGSGTLRHLPLVLAGLGRGRNIPEISGKFLRESVPEISSPPQGTAVKFKAGYLCGCLTDYVFPGTGKKVISFLNRAGVEVHLPRKQGCCGAPVFLGAGDFETGRKMADIMVDAFKNLETVIVDCATCGSAVKDYARYLADTPERQKNYLDLGQKIIHVTAYLTDVLKLPASAYRAVEEARGKTVTWHDPCHLSRHLGVKEQPRKILRSIPDIKYVEMENADRCCGMAGSFSLKFYELSQKIADRKLQTIVATGADIVVSGCPGCEIQLRDTITQHNLPIKVMHIMELLE